ncbi:MAG: L-arabinose isomerase, partial [Chitinophagaceae bacterium]
MKIFKCIGDLVDVIAAISEKEVKDLVEVYADKYELTSDLKKNGTRFDSLNEAARIEAGLRQFLKAGNFKGFTDTFEDLHGLSQLPGLAVQRLMAEGYG